VAFTSGPHACARICSGKPWPITSRLAIRPISGLQMEIRVRRGLPDQQLCPPSEVRHNAVTYFPGLGTHPRLDLAGLVCPGVARAPNRNESGGVGLGLLASRLPGSDRPSSARRRPRPTTTFRNQPGRAAHSVKQRKQGQSRILVRVPKIPVSSIRPHSGLDCSTRSAQDTRLRHFRSY
jgi:hypothetical protein